MFRFIENRLIFYPERALLSRPSDLGLEYDDLYFEAADGVRLHAWYIEPPARGAAPLGYVLFLHGNAGNISHFLDKTAGLAGLGLGVLSVDYRGFGLSGGKPSEAGVYLDSRAAFEALTNRPGATPDKTIIFGYSLGGAAAAQLALEVGARAVIFESTFTSIRDMAVAVFPFLPRFLVSPLFETSAKIGRISTPALFIHGDRDETVPVAMGRRLHELHPGPKRIMIIPGAGHTDVHLVGGDLYLQKIREFIQWAGGGAV
ncbi:MAG: alpha/beta hydrolase [Pseudomonadota bacterium]